MEAAVSPFVQTIVGSIAGFIGMVLLCLMVYAKMKIKDVAKYDKVSGKRKET